MGTAMLSKSLPNAEAAQWNKQLMLEFQVALQEDPATDLISMFPDFYVHEHRNAQYCQLSYPAKINFRLVENLQDTLTHEPEVNLLSVFPKNYSRRIEMAAGSKIDREQEHLEDSPPEFRTGLDQAENAIVVYPLSKEVTTLLAQYSGPADETTTVECSLTLPLESLLWASKKLWESPVRGVVVKCDENIIAKVVTGNDNYTEYTSMRYLMDQAPDIPAPRPHGLVAYGPFRVIFMSYIQGTTLAQAWPSLLHEEKLSIQRQLDDIFLRLRTLQQDNGSLLGGICGEGVRELRVDECASFKGITTAKEFHDLQFSARHHGSTTYVRLLRSFLEHDTSTLTRGSLFTHGDVRTSNIMVKKDLDSGGQYVVTGIIDWEDSGFYPFYYECTVLTRTLSLVDEDDWYLYLSESISPLKSPVRWLVDRLWQIHLKNT